MKKIILMAAVLLMLSCSCQNMTESSQSPALTGTPFQGGSAAASVTGCLSGRDTIGVVLHVSRVIDATRLRVGWITAGIRALIRGCCS